MTEKKSISVSDPAGQNILTRAASVLFLQMIALLPWKMASMVQVQEVPMDYWFTPFEILITPWPIPVFAVLSGLLLLLTLGGGCGSFLIRGGRENLWMIAYVLIWCLTAAAAFLGIIHASCVEYAHQMIYFVFAVCSFTAAAVMLVHRNEGMIPQITGAMLCGMIFSLISGLYQHFVSFDELEQYLIEQSRLTGTDLLAGKMGINLQERRLTADFGICNIYGGFLTAMLPLACTVIWHFSQKFQPQKVSRFVLTIPFLLIALFVIVRTGSRGAWFALLAGGFSACMILPMKIKYRIMALGAAQFGTAGFIVMVLLGRGFQSMRFRLDYFYAAFRMMLEQPLAGNGWGDFFHDYLHMKLLYNNEAPHTPHNMFLLFGSQTGIAGLILILTAVALPFAAGVLLMRDQFRMPAAEDLQKNADSSQKWKKSFSFAVFAGFMIFWADAMLEISFECPAFIAYFNLTAVMLLTMLQNKQKAKKKPSAASVGSEKTEISAKQKHLRYLSVLFVLLMGAVGLFTFYRGYAMGVREYHYSQLQQQISPGYRNTDLMRGMPTAAGISRQLEKVTALAPDSPFPYAEAARFFIACNELQLAEDCISKAVQLAPLRPGFYLTRAKIRYWRAGNDSGPARADLEKIRQLSPKNPDYAVSDMELLSGIKDANDEKNVK